ncbi:hypothetical protein ACFWF3_26335 [Nocardia sp. NPDC060220]|uniref:hypothetical protein n=1 Tax=Nocardia sp. NPDC060220 TaxID=3347076 RepID=UPI0036605B3E
MTITAAGSSWSPADHPDAIAVSEAHQWFSTILLQLHRLRSDSVPGLAGDSRQLDARVLVIALIQLTIAAKLMQEAAKAVGGGQVEERMGAAQQQFRDALPGIEHMRNGLTHFDNWALGKGRGPQQVRRNNGEATADIARDFWYFGFDCEAGSVSLGPYDFGIDMAERAAREMYHLICDAGQALDEENP